MLQRLREAEREVVFEEYSGKEGDIVSGVVQRLEGRNVIIDLGKTEARAAAAGAGAHRALPRRPAR